MELLQHAMSLTSRGADSNIAMPCMYRISTGRTSNPRKYAALVVEVVVVALDRYR